MNFIRTGNGLLNLEHVVEFWISPGDKHEGPELVAITTGRDLDGTSTFISVLKCCCVDSARASLQKLQVNIAHNRLLDPYEVDCPNARPEATPSLKGAN